jgi:hypothetical protein
MSPTSGTSIDAVEESDCVDANRGGVLLDVDPLALGLVVEPVAPAAEVKRLAEFGAERDDAVRFLDRVDRGFGKDILEGTVLEPLDVGRAARGLDHRALHEVGEFLDRRAALGGVHRMAYQQDRLFRLLYDLGGFVDAVDIRALHGQAIALGRQDRLVFHFLEDDVARILDEGRARRAGHRDADRLADDLVGLVGIFDRGGELHRILEHRLVADELDAAAAHAALGDAGALADEEHDRRVLDLGALDGGRHVGDARAERGGGERRLAGDARGGFGHETGGGLVVRGDDFPAALFGLEEQVDEIRIGDAEHGLDAFGLEQVENALVNWYAHECFSLSLRVVAVSAGT